MTRADRIKTGVLPGGVLLGLAAARGPAIMSALQDLGSAEDRLRAALLIAHMSLGAAFYVLVGVLFLRRLPAVATAGGPGPLLLALAGSWGAAPLVMLAPTTTNPAVLIVAGVVSAVGLTLSCYCAGVLGRHFGVRPSARGVVTSGPYARVRHPLYVSEAITQLGFLIVVLSPIAVGVFALHLLLQFGRTVLEERVLAAAFADYRDYQARTARFVPGLI